MQFAPEEWTPIIKLIAVGATIVLTAIGAKEAGHSDGAADRGVNEQRYVERAINISNEYAEYMQSVLAREAGCDAALEAFARHRTNEEDFAMVLERCGSEE